MSRPGRRGALALEPRLLLLSQPLRISDVVIKVVGRRRECALQSQMLRGDVKAIQPVEVNEVIASISEQVFPPLRGMTANSVPLL